MFIELLRNSMSLTFLPKSSRFAPVGFLFERKGLVRVSLDKTVLEDIDSEMERVFDVGLKMDVEDFNDRPSEENEESHELEVGCLFSSSKL